MKLPKKNLKASLLFATAAMSCFLSSCSDGIKSRQWTEDVQLDDGSTILVKRKVTFRESNSSSGDAYNAVEQDATLAFTGDLARLPPWRAPLMALLLYKDRSADEWVVVATTTSCDRWNELGAPRAMYLSDLPNTMYWEFRLEKGAWQRRSISPSSIGRPVNLLHWYQQELKTDHVTVALRGLLQSDPTIDAQFVTIQERPKAHCILTQRNVDQRAAETIVLVEPTKKVE